ncbi:MAG: hypothetical protein M0R77_16010 [Gammaproteobacteria bacterium]|nr:hypothetical protein [Gammaproteobacteria bacterium]
MPRWFAPALALAAAALFWVAVALQGALDIQREERPPAIITAGPVQLLLYGGDRFLGANIESIRAAASVTANDAENFRLRAHLAVSRLNPCHEDNYWIGNASLTWGGAEEQGFSILHNAMYCRYWDEWPAFFYGFNQQFFLHNVPEARRMLEIAAQRSPANAAAFRNFSIMLAAGEIDDVRLAIEMLLREREQTTDTKLREMLNKRVVRLRGLLVLRDAQAAFETRFGQRLSRPEELLERGLLEAFPDDPLRLGYEFRDQTFHLTKLTIQ